MNSGNFEFRYNHTNDNATWHTNPNAKFILPKESVEFKCDDPYLNETQFLEMVKRFFIACGYTQKQWRTALVEHLKEIDKEIETL